MESSNPTLNGRIFANAKPFGSEGVMTIQGAINKTLICFAVLFATAVWTWSNAGSPMTQAISFGAMIVGFILALVTTFKSEWSAITAPIYSACQGLFLGFLSAIFEARYPGIVMQAVGLTFAVTLAMLMGYKAGFLQATPGLRKGLMIAMGGLMLFYIVVMVASLFKVAPPAFINGGGVLGIGFSLFVVGIASMSLILDFDMVEEAARRGAPRHMEWYSAFALMVTLVWLYVEILRLLSKVTRRD